MAKKKESEEEVKLTVKEEIALQEWQIMEELEAINKKFTELQQFAIKNKRPALHYLAFRDKVNNVINLLKNMQR